jgi:hypothetical protein
MKITKRVIAAVEKILIDSRSIDAMRSGQIETENGYMITDGFVLIHSPVSLCEEKCLSRDCQIGGVLLSKFQVAFNTPISNIYEISDPFPLSKVASTLRELCKQYQDTNRFKQSYLTFTGVNHSGDKITATFNTRHIINAFDCVGRKAVGRIYVNKDLFSGKPFILVMPHDNPNNLAEEINAIILQSVNREAA